MWGGGRGENPCWKKPRRQDLWNRLEMKPTTAEPGNPDESNQFGKGMLFFKSVHLGAGGKAVCGKSVHLKVGAGGKAVERQITFERGCRGLQRTLDRPGQMGIAELLREQILVKVEYC